MKPGAKRRDMCGRGARREDGVPRPPTLLLFAPRGCPQALPWGSRRELTSWPSSQQNCLDE